MDQETGWVRSVAEGPIGTFLAAGAASGATVLTVVDAVDLDPDGGSLEVAGVVRTYTSADVENDTITLTTALTAAVEEGDEVWVWDVDLGARAMEVTAEVEIQTDDGTDEDLVPCVVSRGLMDRLPRGDRGGRGEACTITRDEVGSSWRLTDVQGTDLTTDGGYIDPSTLPDLGGDASDGNAPTSPATSVTVASLGFDSVMIRWTAPTNADPLRYRVLLDTVNPPVQQLADTAETRVATSRLPNGTALVPGTTYYARVDVYDEDGNGPASTVASGSPVLVPATAVAQDVLVANAVFSRNGYFGEVSVDQLTAGTLDAVVALVGRLITSASGRRVEVSNESGIVVFEQNGTIVASFPTDPSSDVTLNADVIAKRLSVTLGGEFAGVVTVKTGAEVRLGAAQGGSATPPQAAVGYTPGQRPGHAITGGSTDFPYGRGTFVDQGPGILSGHGYRVSGDRLAKMGIDDTAPIKVFQVPGGTELVGVCRNPSNSNEIYVLRRVSNATTNRDYQVLRYNVGDWGVTTGPAGVAGANPVLVATYTWQAPDNSNPIYWPGDWPVIGSDAATGGYIIAVADVYATTSLPHGMKYRIYRYNQTGVIQNGATGVVTGEVDLGESDPGGTELAGVEVSYFDISTTTYYVAIASRYRTRFFSTAGAWVSAGLYDFPHASDSVAWGTRRDFLTGPANAFSGFSTIARGQSLVTRHSNIWWTTGSSKWWAAFTWYDSTGADPIASTVGNKHESTMSAQAGFTMVPRSYVTLTAQALPSATPPGADEANAVRWYLGRLDGATPPARTAMYLQDPQPAAGVLTWRYGADDPTVLFSGGTPPAATTFPAAVAGFITSEAQDTLGKIIRLQGDGPGRTGPLSWDTLGVVTRADLKIATQAPGTGPTSYPQGLTWFDAAATAGWPEGGSAGLVTTLHVNATRAAQTFYAPSGNVYTRVGTGTSPAWTFWSLATGHDTGWNTVSLLNGWSNYGAGYAPAAYRRIGNRVMLQGLISAGTISSSVTLFTLPAGYRPIYRQILTATYSQINELTGALTRESGLPKDGSQAHRHDTSVGGQTVPLTGMNARLDVDATGNVIMPHSALAAGGWCSLEDVEFMID